MYIVSEVVCVMGATAQGCSFCGTHLLLYLGFGWCARSGGHTQYDDGGIIRFFCLVGACFFDVYRLLAVAITGWSAGLAAVIFIYWGFV